MIRIRISKADFEAGFKFPVTSAGVLYAKVKTRVQAVVDKCQVTIVVDAEKNKKGTARCRQHAKCSASVTTV